MPPARLVVRYAWARQPNDGGAAASSSNLAWHTSFVSHVFKTISKPKYTRSNREVKHIFDEDDVAATDEKEAEVRVNGRERKQQGKPKAKAARATQESDKGSSQSNRRKRKPSGGVPAARGGREKPSGPRGHSGPVVNGDEMGHRPSRPETVPVTQGQPLLLHGADHSHPQLQRSLVVSHAPSEPRQHPTHAGGHVPLPPPSLAPAVLFQEHQRLQHLHQQQTSLFRELQQQQQHQQQQQQRGFASDPLRQQQLQQQLRSLEQNLQQTEQLKKQLGHELLRCIQLPSGSLPPSQPSQPPVSSSSVQSASSFSSPPIVPAHPLHESKATSSSSSSDDDNDDDDDHASFSDGDASDSFDDAWMRQPSRSHPSSSSSVVPSFSYISSSSPPLHRGRQQLVRLGVKEEHHFRSSKENWRAEERRRGRRERADAARNQQLEQYFEALSLAVQDELSSGNSLDYRIPSERLPSHGFDNGEIKQLARQSRRDGHSRVDILQAAMIKIQQLERDNTRMRQEQAIAIIPSPSPGLGEIVRASSWLMMSFNVNTDSFHEVSDSFLSLLGFERLEFLQRHPTCLGPPPCDVELIHQLCKGIIPRVECGRGRVLTKNRTTLMLKSTLYSSRVADQVFVLCLSELLPPDSDPAEHGLVEYVY